MARKSASNLSFHNSICTKDCSGHRAGWKWRKNNPTATVRSASNSFVSGAVIRDLQLQQGRNLIGPSIRNQTTGKFVKFKPI
jgi:hypothetical protein